MLKPTPRVVSIAAESAQKPTLRTLFETEEAPLLRYAFSLVGRRAVAEEIVQDVFLELHRRWEEVDAPRAWLFRSVRNGAYNHFRKSKREVLDGNQREAPPADEDGRATEDLIEQVEAAGVLRQLLGELADKDRQLVQLKYFEGLRYRDISEKTGLSVSNVGYRLHHILKELAEKLRPLGFDKES